MAPKLLRKLLSLKNSVTSAKSSVKSLDACTLENTEKFSMQCDMYRDGKVLRVLDGDTCDVALVYAGRILCFRCRLNGLDTPEMKPRRSIANRSAIISQALASKRYLEELVLNKIVPIRVLGNDKYGRLLIDMLPVGQTASPTVTEMIIQNGHGVYYDGGKKNGTVYDIDDDEDDHPYSRALTPTW